MYSLFKVVAFVSAVRGSRDWWGRSWDYLYSLLNFKKIFRGSRDRGVLYRICLLGFGLRCCRFSGCRNRSHYYYPYYFLEFLLSGLVDYSNIYYCYYPHRRRILGFRCILFFSNSRGKKRSWRIRGNYWRNRGYFFAELNAENTPA